MTLTDHINTLIATWTDRADAAEAAGQTRTATHLYNSAEALEEAIAASDVHDVSGLVVEHGIHWPDGRVVVVAVGEVDRWGGPDLLHASRLVSGWNVVDAPDRVAAA